MAAINPSAAENGFDRLGVVAKVHGLKGEIVIHTDLQDLLQLRRIDVLHINDGRGMMLPYRVVDSRTATQGKRQLFFVILESVADRNSASLLMGRDVWVPTGIIDLFEEEDDDLVGYSVVDNHGKPLGKVIEVLDNPAHPILRVKMEGHGLVLIPFVDVFVGEIDDDQQTVAVFDIEGLLEL